MPSTISKWAAMVSPNFKFTFKLSKNISHSPELKFDKNDVEKFMSIINNAEEKKGAILIQLPPKAPVKLFSQLERLLIQIKKHDKKSEWRVALEFRNESWYMSEVLEMLTQFQATAVTHDLPGKESLRFEIDSAFDYLRFHGTEKGYRGSYSDEFLEKQARKIKESVRKGKTVFAYFNNTMGNAFENLQTLNQYLKA